MLTRRPLTLAGVSILLTLSACGGADLISGTDPAATDPEAASTRPTFSAVQSKVFTACSGTLVCHVKGPFAAGLDLSPANAYNSLVDVPAHVAPDKLRVVPFDPYSSFLYQKLTDTQGASEGQPMPRAEGMPWKELSSSQISLVRRWIASGAPNN